MARLFVYGTLRDPALFEIVSGRPLAAQPAAWAGYAVSWSGLGDWPTIHPEAGAAAEGVAVEVDGEALARIDWYERLFGYTRRAATVTAAAGAVSAAVYWPGDAAAPRGAFDLTAWQGRRGPLARETARLVMAMRGALDPAIVAARFRQIEGQADARLRASVPAAAELRSAAGPETVRVERKGYGYAQFFAVEDYALRHGLYAGGWSEPLERSAFVMGDAVVVLPYDAERDAVLLVEQFRTAPYVRGDARPWTLETVAGRVDPGETPAEAARREAAEEAGLSLAVEAMLAVPWGYPSPGAVTEYLYGFIAPCRLEPGAVRLAGAPEEGEDIRSHVVPFARLMAMIDTGEVATTPLIAMALHLERMRGRLRAAV